MPSSSKSLSHLRSSRQLRRTEAVFTGEILVTARSDSDFLAAHDIAGVGCIAFSNTPVSTPVTLDLDLQPFCSPVISWIGGGLS